MLHLLVGGPATIHPWTDARSRPPVYRARMDPAVPDAQRWRLGVRGRRLFDLALVTALLLPVVPLLASRDHWSWGLVGGAQLVPLYWRRAHAVPVFAVVAVASGAQAVFLDTPLWAQVAFPIATYSVALYSSARWAAAAAVVGVVGALVAARDWLLGFGVDLTVGNFFSYVLTIAAIVVAAWALGTLARTRRAYVDALVERGVRIEHEAAQQVQLAATAERTRIAREMHDVIAHGLSVIVVQADGARYAAERDPAAAGRTLETIAATARDALRDMRQLLGLMRSDGETDIRPQPRLGDLAQLVEDARATGTTVESRLPDRSVDVSPTAALTAYRVVQEALSNVRSHAGPAAVAQVAVSVGRDLAVVVEDDGRGASASDDGCGLGLLGMRERVGVHGGTFEAGPRPGGGFRVAARIPL
jgi:signal transduction histidine kinase